MFELFDAGEHLFVVTFGQNSEVAVSEASNSRISFRMFAEKCKFSKRLSIRQDADPIIELTDHDLRQLFFGAGQILLGDLILWQQSRCLPPQRVKLFLIRVWRRRPALLYTAARHRVLSTIFIADIVTLGV